MRRRLVEAALHCVVTHGYPRASASAIAREAGVSRGALAHHFRSRTELFTEVLLQVGERMQVQTRDIDTVDRPIAARISRYVDETWAVFHGDAFRAALQIWPGTPGLPGLHAAVVARMERYERTRERQWHRMLEPYGISLSEARAARNLMIGTLRGLAFRTLFWRRGIEPQREIQLLKHLLVGLCVPDTAGHRRAGSGLRPRIRHAKLPAGG
ncbi:MAG: TetR/AcrR family transcriptional regulator [Rhodospirillaceae bacterium]|nr:TetR/AcrR family transcriptional regulator [Rhodospirillaceae bacterium]